MKISRLFLSGSVHLKDKLETVWLLFLILSNAKNCFTYSITMYFCCADMIPFANAGNQEKVVDQGQARVIDLPPIESYPQASIQWFEQQGQHLPIPTETQVRIIYYW